MFEFIITVLIAFLLSFCLYAVFFGGEKCSGCGGMYSKEELSELVKELPEGTRIYISIEKR